MSIYNFSIDIATIKRQPLMETATDGSLAVRGTDDNSQAIEEPDEVTNLTSGFEAERRG